MITRHRSDNEDAIINQLIMETLRINVNKDGIRLLGSRSIDPKQMIIIFKHRDETEVSKKCKNSKEMTFFSDVLSVSRPSQRQKTNYLTNTSKSENAVSMPTIVNEVHSRNIYGYLSFHWDSCYYYSIIELSDSVIDLGFTPQNLRKNAGGAVD